MIYPLDSGLEQLMVYFGILFLNCSQLVSSVLKVYFKRCACLRSICSSIFQKGHVDLDACVNKTKASENVQKPRYIESQSQN